MCNGKQTHDIAFGNCMFVGPSVILWMVKACITVMYSNSIRLHCWICYRWPLYVYIHGLDLMLLSRLQMTATRHEVLWYRHVFNWYHIEHKHTQSVIGRLMCDDQYQVFPHCISLALWRMPGVHFYQFTTNCRVEPRFEASSFPK